MPHNKDNQVDDDSLRNMLGITEGSDNSSARAKPLLLFPCPKAEFLEVSRRKSMREHDLNRQAACNITLLISFIKNI